MSMLTLSLPIIKIADHLGSTSAPQDVSGLTDMVTAMSPLVVPQ